MIRAALAAGLSALVVAGLTGCVRPARDVEQDRYTTCVENGGTYTHTEDAWGENWSCKK